MTLWLRRCPASGEILRRLDGGPWSEPPVSPARREPRRTPLALTPTDIAPRAHRSRRRPDHETDTHDDT